jgi:Holliday junction DNA helicase RuvA
MITTLRGRLIQKSPTFIIIEVNGIGYHINISMSTFESLPNMDNEVFLFTELIVREDSLTLFGFTTENERKLFNMLISVSGIGPKSGIGILSGTKQDEFKNAILTGDTVFLKKLPGVGKKTAERLIVELKDKFDGYVTTDSSLNQISNTSEDAVLALISLGYNKTTAKRIVNQAIKSTDNKIDKTEELIKLALKFSMK